MAVIGFSKLEALFRKAASLDIKKGHAKEITDILDKKFHDFLLAAEINASKNGRDVIYESDLPITKGLEETITEFKKLDEELSLDEILEHIASLPPLKYPLSKEVEEKLPLLVGSLLVVMARVMKVVDNESRQVTHELIEKSKEIMDLTL